MLKILKPIFVMKKKFPGRPFHLNPSHNGLELHKIRRYPDFEALKL